MKNLKKIIAVVAVACIAGCLAIGLTGCGEKKLQVVTSPQYPPFENLVDGEMVGFDVELWEAVAKTAGIEFEWKQMQFDAILPAVSAGEADVAISGISITPAREKDYLFSNSYFIDDMAVCTMSANTEITTSNCREALNKAGVTIAVQSGATGESWAKENFPNATIKPFGNPTDIFAALQAGEATAAVQNLSVAADMLTSYTDAHVIYKEATDEQYGILFAKDNTEMQEKVNAALKTLQDNGTIDELKAKWGLI